jgi:hypothetical protein
VRVAALPSPRYPFAERLFAGYFGVLVFLAGVESRF